MLKTISLALCVGLLATGAASQNANRNYGEFYQRTPILVTLPQRPIKAAYPDHFSYREAMRRYHEQTRQILRKEREVYRDMYYRRQAPVILHQLRGTYSPVYHRPTTRLKR